MASAKSLKKIPMFVFSIVLFLLFLPTAFSQPMTLSHFSDYLYLTNHETTVFDEIIWFWTPDTMDGAVHSNDFIGIKFSPQFHDRISTSQSEFIEFAASPWFAIDPMFNVPEVEFAPLVSIMDEYCQVSEDAGNWFGGDSTLTGRLVASEDCWLMERWLEGVPYDSAIVVESIEIPYGTDDYMEWSVIYHEGDLELFGEYVAGKTIVVSTGSIYLLDNICYEDISAESFVTPMQPMPETEHMLNIMAGESIIVSDTWVNGRGNGAAEGAFGNHDRKHIVVTAALQAVAGSFTFEHQNDTWDTYYWCDPNGENAGTPDERGTIWLRGSLSQFRRHYVHRSNCGGTGYAKDFSYDPRFRDNPPPGLITTIPEPLVLVDSTIVIDDSSHVHQWSSIHLGPGAEIRFVDGNRISARYVSEFTICGTSENPVEIVVEDEIDIAPFFDIREELSENNIWENLNILLNGGDLETIANLRNVAVYTDSITDWNIGNDQSLHLDSCILEGHYNFNSTNNESNIELIRTIVKGSIISQVESLIDHVVFSSREEEDSTTSACTFNSPASVLNSFFLGLYEPIIGGNANDLYLGYSGFYGSLSVPPFAPNVEIGEGVFEANPMFVDSEIGDFHLLPDSPLIDAGDPESPLDPDGTITDIGVFYYYQDQVSVAEELPEAIPEDFKISGPYPNPFNSSAIIELELNNPGKVKIDLYDTLGRHVVALYNRYHSNGVSRLRINGDDLATGMYFLRISSGNEVSIVKAMIIK